VRRARDLGLGGALLCALAVALGTPALNVPGLALLLAAIVAPAWVALSAARAEVSLHSTTLTAYEGESVRLTLEVHRGRLPFPDARLVPWPGAGAVALPGRGHGPLELSAVVSRRGPHTLGPARLRVADPLGICERELASAQHELLVLPRIHPVNAPALARLDGRDAAAGRRRSAPAELDGLRPYLSGGASSRIHWPTVARTGALMERGVNAEVEEPSVVVLDASHPASEESLDQALRAVASLCVHLARRGGCRLLLPGDRRATSIAADLRGWPAQHARLALVRPGGGPGQLGRRLAGGTILYVTAASVGAPAIRGRCYRIGPHALAGVGVAFTVAGCSAQLLDGTGRGRVR
jgi:uncharacterized protein (DUF58 family)